MPHPANTVIPLFTVAVGEVLGNDALRVGKGQLGKPKRDAVLLLVLVVFLLIPVETRFCHAGMVAQTGMNAIL
jgi:hypothetical protein